MIARLKYIKRFRDRHGHERVYLRRKGQKSIPLPNLKDPTFLAAYQAALAASAPAPRISRVATDSIEAVCRGYLLTAKFKQLGGSTQVVYRRIIDELCRKHGDKRASMIQSSHIRRMLDEMADRPAAANHFLRTLRAVMKYAVSDKIRQDDPTQGVDRLKEVGEGAESWTEAD